MRGNLALSITPGGIKPTIAAREVEPADFFGELRRRSGAETTAQLAEVIGIRKRTLDGWLIGRPISRIGAAAITHAIQTGALNKL